MRPYQEIYTTITLACHTGLRQGEMLALKWQNVDLKNSRLFVRTSLEQTKGRLRFKEPKTRKKLVSEFNRKFKNGKIILVDTHPVVAQDTIDKSSLMGEVLVSPYTLSSLIVKTDNILKT